MALTPVFWDFHQNPIHTTLDGLFDDLRNDDMRDGLMYEPCSLDDILDGTEPPEPLALDGIVVPFVRMDYKMRQMQMAMNRAGSALSVAGYQVSQPFTRLGVANVAAVFELSDGQTVSVYFHNPDVTPKKIQPQDNLISFKWLLNKKDVTIVVAPERGKEIDVRQVAMRIMKIAEKNSAAFTRQNQKRAERAAELDATQKRIVEKEKRLNQLLQDIDDVKRQIADAEVDRLLAEEAARNSEVRLKKIKIRFTEARLDLLEGNYTPTFDNLNDLQAWLQKIYPMDDLSEGGYRKTDMIFVYGTEKGKNEQFNDRIDVGLSAGDFNPHVQHIADYLKARFQQLNINIGEIKAITPAAATQPEPTIPEPPQPPEPAQPQPENPQSAEPIVVQGNEFGEFDTNTEAGKKALREKAVDYIRSLSDNGDTVFCPALNADVGFNRQSWSKYKKLSGDPKKLYFAAKIKDIIRQGKLVEKDKESYDRKELTMGITYDVLETGVNLNKNRYLVRTVIRKLADGKYQYDLRVNSKAMLILDDVKKADNEIPDTKSGRLSALSINDVTDAPLYMNYGDSNAEQGDVSSGSVVSANKSDLPCRNGENPLVTDDINAIFTKVQADFEQLKPHYSELALTCDDTGLAIDELERVLSIMENNAPINEREGNRAQAALERQCAASFREAIEQLKAATPTLDAADGERYVLNLFLFDKDGNPIEDETADGDEEFEEASEYPFGISKEAYEIAVKEAEERSVDTLSYIQKEKKALDEAVKGINSEYFSRFVRPELLAVAPDVVFGHRLMGGLPFYTNRKGLVGYLLRDIYGLNVINMRDKNAYNAWLDFVRTKGRDVDTQVSKYEELMAEIDAKREVKKIQEQAEQEKQEEDARLEKEAKEAKLDQEHAETTELMGLDKESVNAKKARKYLLSPMKTAIDFEEFGVVTTPKEKVDKMIAHGCTHPKIAYFIGIVDEYSKKIDWREFGYDEEKYNQAIERSDKDAIRSKIEYRLLNEKGDFYTITKIEYDYAKGVLENMAKPQPPTESSQETEPQDNPNKAFLQRVIDGKEDVITADFFTKLEQIGEQISENDTDMFELLTQAVEAYQQQLDKLSTDSQAQE